MASVNKTEKMPTETNFMSRSQIKLLINTPGRIEVLIPNSPMKIFPKILYITNAKW